MSDKDNYFDLFSEMLFGKSNNKNDAELNHLFNEISKNVDNVKNDKTPDELLEYLEEISKNNAEFLPVGRIIEIQNKINSWAEDGLSPEELDNNINNLVGNPTSIVVREIGEEFIEEKSWEVDDGILVRSKIMTEEEVEEWEDVVNLRKYGGPSGGFVNMNYDLNSITDFDEEPLEMQLEKAIDAEEYEKAAKIRDRIKEVKDKTLSEEK